MCALNEVKGMKLIMEKKSKLVFIDEEKIEFYGEGTANSQHFNYLLEYIKKNYSDTDFIFKLLKSGVTDQVVYGLTYIEHKAILLNETKYDGSGNIKYGKFACLELPPIISSKLENQILSLIDFMSDFKQLCFEVSKLDENNCLIGEMLQVDDKLSIEEQVKSAIGQVRGIENKKIR
jgi:hypothetical protein